MIISLCKAVAARLAVAFIALVCILVDQLSRCFGPAWTKRRDTARRLMIVGAFDSAGKYRAHLQPLAESQQFDEILVVSDTPFDVPLENVQHCCPSPMQVRVCGRVLARLLVAWSTARSLHPTLYMGYHIMPNAIFVLLLARLFGGLALYQMTGSPAQIDGGGYQCDNALLRAMAGPSHVAESLLFAIVKRQDAVIVRGSNARQYVLERNLSHNCHVVTGAVDTDRFAPSTEKRTIDLLFVGRLVDVKRVDRFVLLVAEMKTRVPDVRAAIVGDGPLRNELSRLVIDLKLSDNITFMGEHNDVHEFLSRARLFVLLSRSEGMSIAMLESMSAGVPVVVCDVGDHRDVLDVRGGGMLISEFDATAVADRVLTLLADSDKWCQMSDSARVTILDLYSVSAMARRWVEVFEKLGVARAIPLRSSSVCDADRESSVEQSRR